MLFHTWIFLAFFLVFYPLYLGLKGTRFRNFLLLVASYVFYGWWNPLFLFLIVYSTALDYIVVALMDKSPRKKLWLVISLINNLFLLGFFKYAVFVTDNVNSLLSWLWMDGYQLPAPSILLPVGISFYTFQSMSYTIDFYRGQIPRERSFIRFAAFVSLFPQLVAGPIERASSLLPQLYREPTITSQDVGDGLSLFMVGLFKKVALANYLALYADPIFTAPHAYDAASLMLATFAFTWQIYFDFSGYTDMARGIARLMGIRLMLNFNHPYLATGLGDFWNRWHISLSTWFKDYVYIPLGGNRHGKYRTYLNMCITMVVSGLWHGAAWTFIVWGGLHAVGRVVTRELENTSFYRDRIPTLAKQVMIFLFVMLTWIFFRAQSVSDAWLILSRIVTAGFSDPRFPLLAIFLVLAIWLYQYTYESKLKPLLSLPPVRVATMSFMIVYLVLSAPAGEQAFIYFQF